MFSNKNHHIKILYQKKSSSVKPVPGKNTETADYNFGVKDIESLQQLLNTIERGRFGVRRNLENDIKALDGNKENLSEQEKKLLQALKSLQTTQEKINELKKVIQAIRAKHNIQATGRDRVHEMSSGERIQANQNIESVFKDINNLKKLSREKVIEFLSMLQKSTVYKMEDFNTYNPDFGIMALQPELRTDKEILKLYIDLNHKYIGYDEWNKIAELNIKPAIEQKDFKTLNWFFSLNKEISGEYGKDFSNTDQLFGIYLSKMKLKGLDMVKFGLQFNFKEMEGAGINSMGDARNMQKEQNEAKQMNNEAFRTEIQKSFTSAHEDDQKRGNRLVFAYLTQLQNNGKDIYSELGEETINLIIQKVPFSSLPALHEYVSQDKGDSFKLFEKYAEKKGVDILKYIAQPKIKHLEYLFQRANSNPEELQKLHKIIRGKLAYMNLEDEKNSWLWFGNDSGSLSDFALMVEKSNMTTGQKVSILGQNLFLGKLEKNNDNTIKGIYEKYNEFQKMIKESKESFFRASQGAKSEIQKGGENTKEVGEKIETEYAQIVKQFIKSAGITMKPEEMKKIESAIENYMDIDQNYNVAMLLNAIGAPIQGQEIDGKKMKQHFETMIKSISQIKAEKLKKAKKILEKENAKNPIKNGPKNILKDDGTLDTKKLSHHYILYIGGEEMKKIIDNTRKEGKQLSTEEKIQLYLSQDIFQNVSDTDKERIHENIRLEVSKRENEHVGQNPNQAARVITGEQSIDNYNLIQDRVLYHGESVAQATEYANKTLGGPMGTIANTVSSSADDSVSGVASLTKGADPVALSSIISNGALKGVDGYMVQNQGDGMLQIANGDTRLEVPVDQAMAYISNISLLEQIGLGTLVPHMNRINQIIATKNGKQISTLDGKISKEEAKGLLAQFADILGVAKFSKNDGVAEMIARFQNDPHLQSASSISEKLIEKGIVSREGKFLENNFRQIIKGEPSQKTVA